MSYNMTLINMPWDAYRINFVQSQCVWLLFPDPLQPEAVLVMYSSVIIFTDGNNDKK